MIFEILHELQRITKNGPKISNKSTISIFLEMACPCQNIIIYLLTIYHKYETHQSFFYDIWNIHIKFENWNSVLLFLLLLLCQAEATPPWFLTWELWSNTISSIGKTKRIICLKNWQQQKKPKKMIFATKQKTFIA